MLLLLLAVAAIPGSVFPQTRHRHRPRSRLTSSDHPTAGPWLERVGAFDVYASPWFSAIYLLLFVSLVGCVLPARPGSIGPRSGPSRRRRRGDWTGCRSTPDATVDREPAAEPSSTRAAQGAAPAALPDFDAGRE